LLHNLGTISLPELVVFEEKWRNK